MKFKSYNLIAYLVVVCLINKITDVSCEEQNETSHQEAEESVKKDSQPGAGALAGAAVGQSVGQTRYQGVSKWGNSETAMLIKDMKYGKSGKGVSIIRFDWGKKLGQPHVNIDPRGYPSKSNPHIAVPKSVVSGARWANTVLSAAGKGLIVVAAAHDVYRLATAVSDDVYMSQHGEDTEKDLEKQIEIFDEALRMEDNATQRQDISDAIEHVKELLVDVKRRKEVPMKTITTGASIAGGWAGGVAGAVAGAKTGAVVGAALGPVGAAVAGPVGAVVGALFGGAAGGAAGNIAGEAAGEFVAQNGKEVIESVKGVVDFIKLLG